MFYISIFSHCMKRSKFFQAALLVLLVACSRTESPYEHTLQSVEYKDLMNLSDSLQIPSVHAKTLLVIPTRGCTSCIQAALEFTKTKQPDTPVTVIVTGQSAKFSSLLVQKFGIDPSAYTFDKKGLFLKAGLIDIYPTLFRLSGDYTIAVHLDATNIHDELKAAGLE